MSDCSHLFTHEVLTCFFSFGMDLSNYDDWGKSGSGWLVRSLERRRRKPRLDEAGFTSSSGGFREPSVTRNRSCAARNNEKLFRAESSNPGWFRARVNRSYPEGKRLLL
jgi:hypothetical protein